MTTPLLSSVQAKVWEGTLPVHIQLAPSQSRSFDQADPYFTNVPRLSYLPFLLPQLHAFFSSSLIDPTFAPHEGWFAFESIPLKWHLPIGLLFDLYSGAEAARGASGRRKSIIEVDNATEDKKTLPWRLTVYFGDWPTEKLVRCDEEGKVVQDAFINGVKEADTVRYGNARGIMSLSKSDSNDLWEGVKSHDFRRFNIVQQKLLNPPGSVLKNYPVKIYLPSSEKKNSQHAESEDQESTASLRVIQALIPASINSNEQQTIGTALHTLIPTLFPTKRSEILAKAVLHGAVLPLSAIVDEVMRYVAYADGWVHLGIVMMG